MNKLRTAKVTMTLPKIVLEDIDLKRGDVNRSRYILRLIEKSGRLQSPRFTGPETAAVDIQSNPAKKELTQNVDR